MYLSFGLLTLHLVKEWFHLGPKNLFQEHQSQFSARTPAKLWYLELLLSRMHKAWRACFQPAYGAELDWRLHIKQNLNSLKKIKAHHTEKDRLKNLKILTLIISKEKNTSRAFTIRSWSLLGMKSNENNTIQNSSSNSYILTYYKGKGKDLIIIFINKGKWAIKFNIHSLLNFQPKTVFSLTQ